MHRASSLMVLGMVACNGSPATVTGPAAALVGTWVRPDRGNSLEVDGFVFGADGRFSRTPELAPGPVRSGAGRFEADGLNLILHYDSDRGARMDVSYRVDGDRLALPAYYRESSSSGSSVGLDGTW